MHKYKPRNLFHNIKYMILCIFAKSKLLNWILKDCGYRCLDIRIFDFWLEYWNTDTERTNNRKIIYRIVYGEKRNTIQAIYWDDLLILENYKIVDYEMFYLFYILYCKNIQQNSKKYNDLKQQTKDSLKNMRFR